MSKVLEVTTAGFEELLKNHPVTVVDFWAPRCEPCKKLAPVLDEIADEMAEQVPVAKVNVDNEQALAFKHKAFNIPNICIFVGGELKERIIGIKPKSQIIETIKKYL